MMKNRIKLLEISFFLVLLFQGCAFRIGTDKHGKKDIITESEFEIEIMGNCNCISISKYEFENKEENKTNAQFFEWFDNSKVKVRIPFKTKITVLTGLPVLLGVYSSETKPGLSIQIKRNGLIYFERRTDILIAPIYVTLNG